MFRVNVKVMEGEFVGVQEKIYEVYEEAKEAFDKIVAEGSHLVATLINGQNQIIEKDTESGVLAVKTEVNKVEETIEEVIQPEAPKVDEAPVTEVNKVEETIEEVIQPEAPKVDEAPVTEVK